MKQFEWHQPRFLAPQKKIKKKNKGEKRGKSGIEDEKNAYMK